MKVDFATFCHAGDAHRLHAPGQLKRQVESNGYHFRLVHIVYQLIEAKHYNQGLLDSNFNFSISMVDIYDLDRELQTDGIDINKKQFFSSTDSAHNWKNHVVNHLAVADLSISDFIVFADNDCWMVDQPAGLSWVDKGIEILNQKPGVFIVSPNDGEPERETNRFSQQMFMARTEEFRNFDFNQPGWDGNVNVPGGPMPEYWAMLEGRMELGCRQTGKCRYVLGPEYRYWHHNILDENDLFETDRGKY